MIRVALPNKGQLFEPSLEMLTAAGYRVSKRQRSLSVLDADNGVEFFFLRPGDIPVYVATGILEAGVTGKDFVAERQADAQCRLDLDFGHSRLCAAVPNESPVQTLREISDLRIATSFPQITQQFFKSKTVRTVELEGAVEISVRLGIADAIVDIVETGTTLKQAGLRIVGEPMFRSSAALFVNHQARDAEEVAILKSRLEGIMVARAYMMVEYDTPVSLLDKACALTPGIESPTVSPLQDKDWYSVKSMIRKPDSNRIMDQLARLGCKGIVLTRIESARI